MKIIDHKPMFGKDLKYLLVLALLAWLTYSLPSVQAAFQSSTLDSLTGLASAGVSPKCPAGYVCTPDKNLPAHVSSVSFDPDRGNLVTITGWNFLTPGTIGLSLDNVIQNIAVDGTKDGSMLFFRDNALTVGHHILSVIINGKRSNTASFWVDQVSQVSAGQISASIDTSNPSAQVVQISNSFVTNNVPLMVFDLRSSGSPSALNSLTLYATTTKVSIPTLFNAIKIKIASSTYSASSINGSAIQFSNMSVPLPADVSVPVTVYVDVAADTNGTINGAAAAITLMADGSDIVAIDGNYNNVPVVSSEITGNMITFSSTGAIVGNMSTTYGTKTCTIDLATCSQTFSFAYTLTAGNNPVYVSKNASMALSVSIPVSFSMTPVLFTDDNQNGDGANYFYIAPGQTKTFTSSYSATASGSASGVIQVGALVAGSSAGASDIVINTQDVQNYLKAVLFH